MNRDVQSSSSKAPFSRRSKKTVPKPSMDLTPPPRPCRNTGDEEMEEVKEEENPKINGFQLAFGLTNAGNAKLTTDKVEVAYLNETEDEDDNMLLQSSENYRRLKLYQLLYIAMQELMSSSYMYMYILLTINPTCRESAESCHVNVYVQV